MIRKKLSASLKAKIKKEHATLRLRDFAGDAESYLRQVKGAAKGRKVRSDKTARVGEITVPKDSEIYHIIEGSARLKKMSVKSFVSKYKQAIQDLLADGDLVLDRESDKLITDINALKPGRKVYINDGDGFVRTPRLTTIHRIVEFRQYVASNTDIFLIFFRTHFKLNGDIYFHMPNADEYEEMESGDLVEFLMDQSDMTVLRSSKRNIPQHGPEKDKRIEFDTEGNKIKRKAIKKKSPAKKKKAKKADKSNRREKR